MSQPDEANRPAPYTIVMRRNADGVVRECQQSEGQWSRFWFEEGNGHCDCNRAMFFAEANGEEDPDEDCGWERYTILKYTFSDGSELPGDPQKVVD